RESAAQSELGGRHHVRRGAVFGGLRRHDAGERLHARARRRRDDRTGSEHRAVRRAIVALAMLCAVAADAATTRNDDSCDIAVMPAATLLLPYFVVDVGSPAAGAKTTVFTVINTSREPRIARVTLWTDLAFPVLNFNLFLTGYDAQAINLYDV